MPPARPAAAGAPRHDAAPARAQRRLTHAHHAWLLQRQGDWIAAIRDRPLAQEPGSAFLTASERDSLARQVCSAGARLHYGLDTICLAVAVFDTACSKVKLQHRYALCAALACLYMAVKICEELDTVPGAGEWLRAADPQGLYSRHELVRMEMALLPKLGWDLALPTECRFLQAMLEAGDLRLYLGGAAAADRLRQLVANAICSYKLRQCASPAAVALGAIALLLCTEAGPRLARAHVQPLANHFQVGRAELQLCVDELRRLSTDENVDALHHNGADRWSSTRKRQRLNSILHTAAQHSAAPTTCCPTGATSSKCCRCSRGKRSLTAHVAHVNLDVDCPSRADQALLDVPETDRLSVPMRSTSLDCFQQAQQQQQLQRRVPLSDHSSPKMSATERQFVSGGKCHDLDVDAAGLAGPFDLLFKAMEC